MLEEEEEGHPASRSEAAAARSTAHACCRGLPAPERLKTSRAPMILGCLPS